MNGTEKTGCCGAYCKTCREFRKACKGCKLGYLDGSRDLSRAISSKRSLLLGRNWGGWPRISGGRSGYIGSTRGRWLG